MRVRETRYYTLTSLVVVLGLSSFLGCAPKEGDKIEVTDRNYIQKGNSNLVQSIGDSENEFTVFGIDALKSKVAAGEYVQGNSIEAAASLNSRVNKSLNYNLQANLVRSFNENINDNLLVAIPLKTLEQPLIFGSVVTQVSDRTREDLGNLKLSDIPTFQVLPLIRKLSDQTHLVTLIDCGEDCTKVSEPQAILEIPIVALDKKKKKVVLDLSSLGRELDLAAIRKGDPIIERFKSISSKTVRFDYSHSTLVFDVETQLVPKSGSTLNAEAPVTTITNRWYLKTESGFNPNFITRKPTKGVGYFLTERSSEPLIQRWDFDQRSKYKGIKYYIKHVPAEYQPAFARAFESWNEKLKPIIGKRIFSYEFIPEEDKRNELIIAGDVRYNVMEWDLVNKASYGGLGPSLANQYTGEEFQANVLIQGPTIVGLYSKWFKINERAKSLRMEGRQKDADGVLKEGIKEIQEQKNTESRVFDLKLTDQLKMTIRSQQPSLEDPIMAKDEFEPIPDGYTFETYMEGYFYDMVAHELGHNLGLRHNFKGNLGAKGDSNQTGDVSRSIMEYLGRSYRYLDEIGEYDLMAIAYGYTGAQPEHVDWFCTDEDVADLDDPSKSAECSRDDATNNPFDYFQSRLGYAVDLLIARGKSDAPDWTLDDLNKQLSQALVGLGAYVVSASQTSNTWTNFFSLGDHPSSAAEVRNYVLVKLKNIICDPSIDEVINSKSSPEGLKLAKKNMTDLHAEVEKKFRNIFTSTELICQTLP